MEFAWVAMFVLLTVFASIYAEAGKQCKLTNVDAIFIKSVVYKVIK